MSECVANVSNLVQVVFRELAVAAHGVAYVDFGRKGGRRHEVEAHHPLVQLDVALLHDGARRDGEVLPAVRVAAAVPAWALGGVAALSLAAMTADWWTVRHTAREYARGDVHTNSVEGYFSIFKRGMRGIYQHCREKHLHRYLAEYDFRYNHRVALGFDDLARATAMVKGADGKRLTYRQPDRA
jgi:hypothetical protein